MHACIHTNARVHTHNNIILLRYYLPRTSGNRRCTDRVYHIEVVGMRYRRTYSGTRILYSTSFLAAADDSRACARAPYDHIIIIITYEVRVCETTFRFFLTYLLSVQITDITHFLILSFTVSFAAARPRRRRVLLPCRPS